MGRIYSMFYSFSETVGYMHMFCALLLTLVLVGFNTEPVYSCFNPFVTKYDV